MRRKLHRAVFLDRDGTINREVGNLRSVGQLRILPGVAHAIKELNKLGFLVIVATNQPVVARGWVTEKEIDAIHAVLVSRLGRRGAKIDAIYYCPHHPEANLKKYRLQCRCRKPNIGMIIRATKGLDVDLRRSFMAGDSTRDILTGKKAGLKTILIRTGYAGKDGKYAVRADFTAKNLSQAVKIIKKNAKK